MLTLLPVVILGSILVFFILLLLVQSMTTWRFCAMCGAVSMTWIGALALQWSGVHIPKTLIVLLVGQSTLGLYFLVERHVRPSLLVFRLPFLLTLTLFGWMLVSVSWDSWSLLLLLVLWGIMIGIYLFQAHPWMRGAARRLLECCKNW